MEEIIAIFLALFITGSSFYMWASIDSEENN